MNKDENKLKYVPGMYAKKRSTPSQMAEKYIHEWMKMRAAKHKTGRLTPRISNCICFSRKIGVGALETGDLLAEKVGFKIVDREVLEHICNDAQLRESTVSFFDERYPGAAGNFLSMMFGERSFTMGDYLRRLACAVYSIADSGPTIFVGRGTHLILPREKTLAVRFISSKEHRINRVAKILGVEKPVAEKTLEEEDKNQRNFFKKNFGKKDASPYEFDLVINCDHLKNPIWSADIVYKAYISKFGDSSK